MSSATPVTVIVLGGLSLCVACTGSDSTTPADDSATTADCAAQPLSVAPGTGDFEYLALETGDPLIMRHGPQGGWHFDTGGLVTGAYQQLTILPTVRLTASDLQIAGEQDLWFALLESYLPETCSGYFWGKRAHIDDHLPDEDYQDFICSLEGQEVEVCLFVTDVATNQTTSACRLGTAVLDEYDVDACAE